MMKHFLLLSLFILLFASCGSDVEEQRTQEVTFQCDNIEVETRATLSEAKLTDLWVWEGTTLLAHQVSSDADFGSPKITLTYGQHTLTFVASKADGQTWANGVWSTTKEWETFGAVEVVSVSGETNRHSVQLARRSSKVKFVTTDKVPAEVKTLHLVVGNHKSLDAALVGGTAYSHEGTVDMTSKVGAVYSVYVNVLTESATDEEDCNVMIEFLDASSPAKVLYHYERTVKLKANRCVSLKGEYFSGESNSVSIASTAWDEVEQGLFPSE